MKGLFGIWVIIYQIVFVVCDLMDFSTFSNIKITFYLLWMRNTCFDLFLYRKWTLKEWITVWRNILRFVLVNCFILSITTLLKIKTIELIPRIQLQHKHVVVIWLAKRIWMRNNCVLSSSRIIKTFYQNIHWPFEIVFTFFCLQCVTQSKNIYKQEIFTFYVNISFPPTNRH